MLLTCVSSLLGMAPFRWPELSHDVALAIEVMATRPDKAQDWENIAEMLSGSFSSADKAVVLKGRGCRDRMDLLLKKYKTDDAKALKKCVPSLLCVYVLHNCKFITFLEGLEQRKIMGHYTSCLKI